MSRSFRDLLKFSAPVLLSAALLSGCGSGSSGSADLRRVPSVESASPPVTVTETFDFSAPNGVFVVGTPPVHARFSGGVAENNGAWIVKSGTTAVIDFATPADTVEFSTQDIYTAAAAQNALAGATPYLRLCSTVAFQPIEAGTRVVERIRIEAPRPLASVTARKAVEAHTVMLAGIRRRFEPAPN